MTTKRKSVGSSVTDERMAGRATPLARTFGAGGHPSTQLATVAMLRELANRRRGVRVLDAGSGCGPLAQIADALEAKVIAVDRDPEAVLATRREAKGATVIHAELGDFLKRSSSFDVVVANLPELELIELLPSLLAIRADRGVLIATGVLLSCATRLRKRAGSEPTSVLSMSGYVALSWSGLG